MAKAYTDSQSTMIYLDSAKAADLMRLPRSKIARLCRNGELSGAYKNPDNGRWLIPSDAVDKWLNREASIESHPTTDQDEPPSVTTRAEKARPNVKLPNAPFWQWLLAIVTILAGIAGFWADSLGVWDRFFITKASPEAAVPTLTTTPLAAPTATTDEILILLTDFNDESDNVTYDAASSIEDALQNTLRQYRKDLSNVRLLRLNQTFRRNDIDKVKEVGELYNATIFIWGHYDDGGMFPRFTILQNKGLELSGGPQDCLVNLANPPDDFTFYVNKDLPLEMTFFTQFALGQIFFLNKSYSKALTLFDNAIKSAEAIKFKEPPIGLAAVFFCKGVIYQTFHKDNKQALFTYNKSIELDPDYVKPYVNRGSIYHLSGDFEKAVADFSQAIKLDSKNISAYVGRGLINEDVGNLKQAIADFNKAIQLDPNHPVAYFGRGLAYKGEENFEEAILDFNKAIELGANFPVAYFERGRTYIQLKDLSNAILDFDKAIELDLETNAPAYYELGNELFHSNFELEDAYYARGLVYRDLGNQSKSILDFNNAIELNPEFAQAYLQRAIATYPHFDDYEQVIIQVEPENLNDYFKQLAH